MTCGPTMIARIGGNQGVGQLCAFAIMRAVVAVRGLRERGQQIRDILSAIRTELVA